jgi:hypothetical protein
MLKFFSTAKKKIDIKVKVSILEELFCFFKFGTTV